MRERWASAKVALPGLLLLGLALLWSPGDAQASDGLCRATCVRTLARCYDAAGCVNRSCRDGSPCRSGRCDDGSSCGWSCTDGPAAAACLGSYGTCLDGCRDWLVVDLRLPEQLDIDPVIRNEMLGHVDALDAAIAKALAYVEQAAAQHLGAYGALAQGLADKQLDATTAWTLQELAHQAELGLSAANVRKAMRDWAGSAEPLSCQKPH